MAIKKEKHQNLDSVTNIEFVDYGRGEGKDYKHIKMSKSLQNTNLLSVASLRRIAKQSSSSVNYAERNSFRNGRCSPS